MEFWKVLESVLKEGMDNDPSTMRVGDELTSRILILAMLSQKPLFWPLFHLLFTSVCYLLYTQTGWVVGVESPPPQGGGRRRGGVKEGGISSIIQLTITSIT